MSNKRMTVWSNDLYAGDMLLPECRVLTTAPEESDDGESVRFMTDCGPMTMESFVTVEIRREAA